MHAVCKSMHTHLGTTLSFLYAKYHWGQNITGCTNIAVGNWYLFKVVRAMGCFVLSTLTGQKLRAWFANGYVEASSKVSCLCKSFWCVSLRGSLRAYTDIRYNLESNLSAAMCLNIVDCSYSCVVQLVEQLKSGHEVFACVRKSTDELDKLQVNVITGMLSSLFWYLYCLSFFAS